MSLHYTLATAKNSQSLAQAQTSKTLPSRKETKSVQTWEGLSLWFSDYLRVVFAGIKEVGLAEVEEVRLRTGKPLLLQGAKREYFIGSNGKVTTPECAYRVRPEDLAQTLERMTQSSLYAAEEDLRQGFITLPGGHRVGVTGETIIKENNIQTLKHISGLNLRLAREVPGRALEILPFIFDEGGNLRHTLIISPPRAGKTTLLRDLIRTLSNGEEQLKLSGAAVGVVDERGELAGMWQGIPTFDLGWRTDVLDGCPKALGISMLVRSMGPKIIAVDELGHPNDIQAVADALRAGVSILSTAHANSLEEARSRPILGTLLAEGAFDCLVVLSRRRGPGTIEGIHDLKNKRLFLLDH